MIKSYIVYCHTDTTNNKKYIGITCRTLEQRCGLNGSGYLRQSNGKYHQPLFAHAIISHGWEAFAHEILFSNLTEQEAKQQEKLLIAKFKTNDPKYGYNISIGGESNKKYITEEEQLAAKLANSRRAGQKFKDRCQADDGFHQHALEIRRNWYHNKIQNNEDYHKYILERSKKAYKNRQLLLSAEEKQFETKHHTELVKQNRAEQQNKKEYLKQYINDNKEKFISTEAQAFIKDIKWYKIGSMKQLNIIEQQLRAFVENN